VFFESVFFLALFAITLEAQLPKRLPMSPLIIGGGYSKERKKERGKREGKRGN
jgi:hypothetical protein